jgi:hypothetical protein
MPNLSTATGGPNYIAKTSTFRTTGAAPDDRNYVSGVIAYGFERIRETISRSIKPAGQELASAPHFQATPAARLEIKKFASSLEAFIVLDTGWNGPGSSAPSSNAIAVALVGCWNLVQAGYTSPKPKILADGTLGGYWKSGSLYATLDFEEDGEHIWTVTNGKTFKSGTWKSGEMVPKAINLSAEVHGE